MKRKFIVFAIAAALVVGLIGSCFALFKRDATHKTVSISAGDAVILGINTTENFNVSGIQPGEAGAKTLAVTLNASNSGNVEEGKVGSYSVILAPATVGNTQDEALAAALQVSATGKDSANDDYSATHTELSNGHEIALAKAPLTTTLKFMLPESFATGSNFGAVAGGQVAVTIKWEIVDKWTVSNTAYYLVGTRTGWTVTKNTPVIDGTPSTGNKAQKENFDLISGEEFKIVTNVHLNDDGEIINDDAVTPSNNAVWYSGEGGGAEMFGYISIGTVEGANGNKGNVIVNDTGKYNIYVNNSNKIYIESAATQWDGRVAIDVSSITSGLNYGDTFETASATMYVYYWYPAADNITVTAFPGVKAEKVKDGHYYIELNTPDKSLAGFIVTRRNPAGTQEWNRATIAEGSLPSSTNKTITINTLGSPE